MSKASKKRHIGTDFDDFLEEESLLEEAESVAEKRVFVYLTPTHHLR